VILDVHREMALAMAERYPFRHRPARQSAVSLEPEIVVEPSRRVPLNDEARLVRWCLCLSEGLRRLVGPPTAAVLVQAHLWIVA
jgi:hypothetical protein